MSGEQAKMVAGDAAHDEPQAGAASRRNGFHAARMEAPRFRLDLGRSLKQHRRMALGIALFGIALAAAYLVRYWPVYSAETLIYIQPAPVVETSAGVAMHWPYNYDPATYDSYVQQQMLSMTRSDVLKGAAGMLQNFQKSGESEDDAAARLGRAIEVARVGNTYEVAIRAQAGTAQLAADTANAAAASYIENTVNEQKAGDAERIELLREQADRVKKQLDDDRAELTTQQGTAQMRSGDRLAEIALLQNRYDALDAQIQDLSIQSAAAETAHVATKAVAPAHPIADGVVRNAVIALAAFLMLAMLAAVLARNLDQRIYVGADVEQVVGFAPIAELPDFNEVSKEVFEEQLLRLAAAVEFAFAQGYLRSCVFIGASAGTGVSTIAGGVRSLLEGMSRPAALVDAAGKPPAFWPSSGADFKGESTEVRPLMLIRRAAEEARMGDGSAVLADAAPLAISAEAEFLVRNADCVIVVLESGSTRRAAFRATARTLQRLDVRAVGYVLNRVALARADAAFRESLAAMEDRVRMRSRKAEDEPVRTRRVEARSVHGAPQTAAEQARNEWASASPRAEPTVVAEPPGAAPAAEAAARYAAGGPVREPVGAAPKAEEPPVKRQTQRVQVPEMPVQPPSPVRMRNETLPWWLADPILSREAPVERHRTSEPEEAPREEAVPAGQEAAAASQESRLSSLRKLFSSRNAMSAGGAPASVPGEKPAPATEGRVPKPEERKTGPEPERDRAFASGREVRTQPSAADRRATPEITALPEFLPPGTVRGGKSDEAAASRRERRDTWDDVSVLPSWRGQYRRKE